MDFSPALAYRFKKDFKLPFPIESNETFFNYYLELFEERLHCKLDWDWMISILEKYKSPEEMLEKYNLLKDAAINTIKSSEKYEEFTTSVVPSIQMNFSSGDVYKTCNVGKRYLSIDAKNANFQALKKFGVINSSSYKQFIWDVGNASGMADDIEILNYISESKYTRQVIFGNCNPKKTIAWEKYYIYQIYEYLVNDAEIFNNWPLVAFNSDEFIFEIPNGEFFDLVHAQHIEELIYQKFNLYVRVNKFSFDAVSLISQNTGKKITTAYLVDEWGFKKFKCLPETFAPLFEEWLIQYNKTGNVMLNHFNEFSRYIIHDGLLCEISEKLYIYKE